MYLSCACVHSLWTPVAMSWRSSRPEMRRPASRWGLLWESSSLVPWFILNIFREVSGVVPEWPWSSGFMTKTSSLASAPSIRFSVLLNSCDNFLVTLPSLPSETWVIESSCDLGTFEFCAILLPGCSSEFSLFKAASFLCCELPFYGKVFWRLIIDWIFIVESNW